MQQQFAIVCKKEGWKVLEENRRTFARRSLFVGYKFSGINSPGGQVSSGLGIYDTMQLIEPDVATICTGLAASMASVLLCAGAAGKRSALPHSRVLIHQPLGGAQGQASDILIAAREIEKTRTELYRIISEHSGQSVEKIAADADRDYWMTAEEAKAYGMVDEILVKKAR